MTALKGGEDKNTVKIKGPFVLHRYKILDQFSDEEIITPAQQM